MNYRKYLLPLCATALLACGQPNTQRNPVEPANNQPANNQPANNTPSNNQPSNNEPTNSVVEPTPNESYEALMSQLQAVQGLTADDLVAQYDPGLLPRVSYDPSAAANLSIIQQSALALDSDELDTLNANGFVISTQHQFPSFVYGYETLYMQDLPLYVSADSILHAVHRSYDSILKSVEVRTLIPELQTLLTDMRGQLSSGALARYPQDVQDDVDFYLAVSLSLLSGQSEAPVAGADPAVVDDFVQKATDASGATELSLFGANRNFDFSQFKPRGHYTDSEELSRYFRSMMWLGRVDMRVLEPTRRTSWSSTETSSTWRTRWTRSSTVTARSAGNAFTTLWERSSANPTT